MWRAALDAKGISYTVDSDGDYKIVLGTNDDRTQLAFVRSSTNEYGNMEIREIWSFGYKADGDEFPKVRRQQSAGGHLQ